VKPHESIERHEQAVQRHDRRPHAGRTPPLGDGWRIGDEMDKGDLSLEKPFLPSAKPLVKISRRINVQVVA